MNICSTNVNVENVLKHQTRHFKVQICTCVHTTQHCWYDVLGPSCSAVVANEWFGDGRHFLPDFPCPQRSIRGQSIIRSLAETLFWLKSTSLFLALQRLKVHFVNGRLKNTLSVKTLYVLKAVCVSGLATCVHLCCVLGWFFYFFQFYSNRNQQTSVHWSTELLMIRVQSWKQIQENLFVFSAHTHTS